MGMFDWMPAMPTFFKPSTPVTPPPPPSNTPLGVPVGARRKSHRGRTYRKEKRPAKRRRNGKRSIRS
jgi:hypothetical protein